MALVTRTLTGLVRVDGKDAEDFGSDEFIHEPRPIEVVLLENQDTLIPDIHDYRWGGECRVEIDMHAMLQPRSLSGEQNIHIWGQTRFYEGDSEDTTDLEDWKDFWFDVPRHRSGAPPITYGPVTLVNHVVVGHDDWANILFQLKNTETEED